jgi:hypothetical protein
VGGERSATGRVQWLPLQVCWVGCATLQLEAVGKRVYVCAPCASCRGVCSSVACRVRLLGNPCPLVTCMLVVFGAVPCHAVLCVW